MRRITVRSGLRWAERVHDRPPWLTPTVQTVQLFRPLRILSRRFGQPSEDDQPDRRPRWTKPLPPTPTRSRSTAWTPSSSRWATPSRRRTTTPPPSACGCVAYSRTGDRQPRRGERTSAVGLRAVRPHRRGARRHRARPAHVAEHGDGVVDLALEVPDVDGRVRARASRAAPRGLGSRTTSRTSTARSRRGDRHLRRDPAHPGRPVALPGPYLPGFVAAEPIVEPPAPAAASRRSTTASATSSSARWTSGCDFYDRVMGFTNMAEFIGDDIATEYSALM